MARRSSVHEEFLANIPLAVIVDYQAPFKSININSNLKDALILLCSKNTQSLPVFDPKSSKDYQYVASRLDIIAMLAWSNCNQWKESPLLDVLESESHAVDPQIFQFTMNHSVIDCLDSFSKGVHHILVKNEQYQTQQDAKHNDDDDDDPEFDTYSNGVREQKYYWLSQFDIVSFLYTNLQRMSAIVDAPINKIALIKERKLDDEKLYSVNHTMLAKEAFKIFLVHETDAVAILDEEGKLLSHISESDIIGVGPEAINFLITDEYLTIADFINTLNKENSRDIGPISCKKNEIFKELIKKIVEYKSNHIWIVDDDNKPIKLITLNDIICKFSPYDYKTNRISKRLSLIATNTRQAQQVMLKEESDQLSDDSDY